MTAEELYNESLASDNDQWLFFQIEKVPASQQMEQLKMWLATNKPSQVSSLTILFRLFIVKTMFSSD